MYYCSAADVYATAGITSSEVPEANIELFIQNAQGEVDRFTNTTYWNKLVQSTATDGTSTTLVDTNSSFSGNEYEDLYVWIYSGTGSGQVRQISSNTSTTLTVSSSWDTNPDSTSQYRIFNTGTEPYVENELRDGDDTDTIYLYKYPVRVLESVSSDSTSITISAIFLYNNQGKLVLDASNAEKTHWTSEKAQKNDFTYWYGVYPIPHIVKRYTMIIAALQALQSQMGGTHNIPSTYSLPEGSVTIGQAYVNIRGTYDVLSKEKMDIEKRIVRYVSVA